MVFIVGGSSVCDHDAVILGSRTESKTVRTQDSTYGHMELVFVCEEM
jgi:hypothetical protein